MLWMKQVVYVVWVLQMAGPIAEWTSFFVISKHTDDSGKEGNKACNKVDGLCGYGGAPDGWDRK